MAALSGHHCLNYSLVFRLVISPFHDKCQLQKETSILIAKSKAVLSIVLRYTVSYICLSWSLWRFFFLLSNAPASKNKPIPPSLHRELPYYDRFGTLPMTSGSDKKQAHCDQMQSEGFFLTVEWIMTSIWSDSGILARRYRTVKNP